MYKGGEANREYENEFFRWFASNLAEMFKREGMDGILIGHPKVPGNQYLKPDCVLITANRLVIVDFKNFEDGTEVWLPNEADFETAAWTTSHGVIVKGGSMPNPFAQLKRQREWTHGLIGDIYESVGGIAAVVCFQNNVTVLNKVPGRYQKWFSVTNEYQVFNKIKDVIDVRNKCQVDIDDVKTYFEAKVYEDYAVPVFREGTEAVAAANQKSEEALREKAKAEQEVERLKKEIERAQRENRTTDSLRYDLSKAREELEEAKREVARARDVFERKNHDLEMAIQNTIQKKALARQAEANRDRQKMRSKSSIIVTVIVSAVMVIGMVGAAWYYIDQNSRKERAVQEAAEELERRRRAGEECIPVSEVKNYVGASGVCVEYYVTDVGGTSYGYVFLNDKTHEADRAFIAFSKNKNVLNVDDSKKKYLNKMVRVRGDIVEYKGVCEIEIYRKSQVELVE